MEAMNQIIGDYMQSDEFKETLQNSINECVSSNIKSMFSYGDFSSQIRKGLEERLVIDFNQIEFPEYNRIIIETVKAQVLNVLKTEAQDILIQNLTEILTPMPKEVTVQDIVDLVREDQAQWHSARLGDKVEVEIEQNEYGSFDLKIWDIDGKTQSYSSRENSPVLDLYVNDSGKIRIIRTGNLSKDLMTSNYGVEAKLYLMYCQGTRITDIGDCDADYLETYIEFD